MYLPARRVNFKILIDKHARRVHVCAGMYYYIYDIAERVPCCMTANSDVNIILYNRRTHLNISRYIINITSWISQVGLTRGSGADPVR